MTTLPSRSIPWPRIVAEGVAIVASILLAFGIQAWWEGRRELDRERRTLVALVAEFEENAEVLGEAQQVYRRYYTEAVRLLELMDRDPAEIEQAEFDQLIRTLLSSQTFHFETGAHDALLASGEMDVIRDEGLRNRLAAWPSHVAEWSEEMDAVFSLVEEVIVPYLTGRWRLRDVGPPLAPFPDGVAPRLIPSGSSDASSRALLSDAVEFENLVYRRTQGTWYAIRDGETLEAHLNTTLSLLRQNLRE